MSRRVGFALGALAALAFLSAFTGVWDPDFFHHLALGRAVARGADFASDPLVYPFAESYGKPGYWLGSLLIYLPSTCFGTTGSVVFAGLLIAGCVAILFWDGLDGRDELPFLLLALAFTALAMTELRIRSAPRPELFGNLLLAYTLLAIRRFERGRPRLLFAFPLIALAWAQIHVSVAMGLGVVAIHLGWRLASAAVARVRGHSTPAGEPRELGTLAGLFALALFLSFLTPSGSGALRLAGQFLASLLGEPPTPEAGNVGLVIQGFRQRIEELHPPALSDWTRPFGLLVVLSLLSCALHRTRESLRQAATILAFAFFASTAFRFTPLASIVAAPIAARNLASWLTEWQARGGPRRRWAAMGLAALLLGRAASTPTLAAQPISLEIARTTFPIRAAEYLESIRFDGRLYNNLGIGGFLEWTLDRPVFQDGRGPARPDDLAERFPEPASPDRMALLDARWRFDALVLSTEFLQSTDPAIAAARFGSPGSLADPQLWALVAFDDAGSLFLRRGGRWGGLAARDEYRLVAPGLPITPATLSIPSLLPQLAVEYARAVREAPACVVCRVNLATLHLHGGDAAAARDLLAPASRSAVPSLRATLALLSAAAAERLGDHAAAERHYLECIRNSADPGPIRRRLAIMLSHDGRDTDAAALLERNLASKGTAEDYSLAAVVARRLGRNEAAAAFDRDAEAMARSAAAEALVRDGIARLQAGDVAAARSSFQRAAELNPGSSGAQTGLGFVDLASGSPATAAAAFTRATGLDAGYGEAWLGLGLARERLGATGEAIAAYRRCVELRAASPEANAARERMTALGAR